MKHLVIAVACLIAALLVGPASAAPAPQLLLVDAAWLATHLDDPDLVLLHVGDADEYAAGHIAGARHVALDDIAVSEHTREGLMLQMPAAEDLRERLQRLGISDASRIVVYWGSSWVSPATRVVFTLQHAGLGDRTSLLDGGMPAWQRAGHTLSRAVPAARRGSLAPLQMQDSIVDAGVVRANLATSGLRIVDGRAEAFYDGVAVGDSHGRAHRSGHIRGARSIPFTAITDERLQLRPLDELRALFTAAGVAPGDTVVAYCHIGQQATAVLFAARLLGHPVKLYDGSFEDWSRGDDRPVARRVAPVSP